MHKAGFVNIVGNPNVGKSTLMNLFMGERISIATFKAQTTRHRIMGILNTDDMQIVFSDTPGVLKPNYKLQESMLAFSESALQDADVLLYVTDVVEKPDKNEDFLQKVRKMSIPVLVLINKIDLSNQQELEKIVELWHDNLPAAEIIPVCATAKFNSPIARLTTTRISGPTSPRVSSSPKSFARKSCSITTKRYLMPLRSLWSNSRKAKRASTSMPLSTWSAKARRASLSGTTALL